MNNISLIDLKPKIDYLPYPIPDIIISLYEHPITLQEYEEIIYGYKLDNSAELLGIELNKELLGLIGLRVCQNKGFIKHFGILPEYQYQGIGSRIIKTLPAKYSLDSLEAVANNDTVEFYKKLGFIVHEIQNTLSSTPKYMCTLKI